MKNDTGIKRFSLDTSGEIAGRASSKAEWTSGRAPVPSRGSMYSWCRLALIIQSSKTI